MVWRSNLQLTLNKFYGLHGKDHYDVMQTRRCFQSIPLETGVV